MNIKKYFLDNVIDTAYCTGKFIHSKLGKIKKINYKQNDLSNVVTDVDKASEKIIIKKLHAILPEADFLGEESGENKKGSLCKWIVDPLDGTTNFAHGFPFFCVSIGLQYKNEIILGVVYDPNRDEMFYAIKNRGAFLNKKRIYVSREKKISTSLLATGFSYKSRKDENSVKIFSKFLKSSQAIRRAGSAALDLCYTACGRFDGYWEQGLSPWDTAAASLIVLESSGKVTKFDNKKFSCYDKEILATNGNIHKEMLKIINGSLLSFRKSAKRD
jgi:myo-inositol-1(or 4)-monophosphatase